MLKKKPEIVHSLQQRHAEIVEIVAKTLVSKAFENRYTLHPRRLKEIASVEVQTYVDFFLNFDSEVVTKHGRMRAREGLGEGPLLALGKDLRRFSLDIAKDLNHGCIEYAMDINDAYLEAYLYGYMTERTTQTLDDQEQLRIALSKALERQRQELQIKNHAIHTYVNGIMITDMDGTITYVNPAFQKMWGYENSEELPSVDSARFLDIENFSELIDLCKGSGGWQNEFTAVRTDNSTFSVVVSASLIQDEKSEPIGIMASFADVTERKRLETRLQRANKMEALGTLAGGVAHDLNNILSGLVSYPELLLLDLPEDSTLRKPILTIKESGDRAAAIVQDLLTLARRGVAVKDVVNLTDIVSEYLISPEYAKLSDFYPDLRLKTDLEVDLLNILGSPVHLAKTVMNLVTNAAEAMPDGGEILISTENRYIDRPIRGYDHVEEGDYVLLTVSDMGVGIASKDMERIFEPFYTRKVMGRSGSGLGMAVVWGTVKDHKGYIDVKSNEGKGTAFALYFPATRREVTKDMVLIPMEDYLAQGETILVVDDVETQREIATRMLARLGYSVTSVSSGEEAVDYLKSNSADLLLLDMIMDPGIDGLETYKRILNFRPQQKAIMVSGFSETSRVKEAQKMGAGPYLKKPYSLEKIGKAIRGELEK